MPDESNVMALYHRFYGDYPDPGFWQWLMQNPQAAKRPFWMPMTDDAYARGFLRKNWDIYQQSQQPVAQAPAQTPASETPPAPDVSMNVDWNNPAGQAGQPTPPEIYVDPQTGHAFMWDDFMKTWQDLGVASQAQRGLSPAEAWQLNLQQQQMAQQDELNRANLMLQWNSQMAQLSAHPRNWIEAYYFAKMPKPWQPQNVAPDILWENMTPQERGYLVQHPGVEDWMQSIAPEEMAAMKAGWGIGWGNPQTARELGVTQGSAAQRWQAQGYPGGELSMPNVPESGLGSFDPYYDVMTATTPAQAPFPVDLDLTDEEKLAASEALGLNEGVAPPPPPPNLPPELAELMPWIGANQPLPYPEEAPNQPVKTPSGQWWTRTPWTTREMALGLAEYTGRPAAELLQHMALMQPNEPSGAGRLRWRPARQYA